MPPRAAHAAGRSWCAATGDADRCAQRARRRMACVRLALLVVRAWRREATRRRVLCNGAAKGYNARWRAAGSRGEPQASRRGRAAARERRRATGERRGRLHKKGVPGDQRGAPRASTTALPRRPPWRVATPAHVTRRWPTCGGTARQTTWLATPPPLQSGCAPPAGQRRSHLSRNRCERAKRAGARARLKSSDARRNSRSSLATVARARCRFRAQAAAWRRLAAALPRRSIRPAKLSRCALLRRRLRRRMHQC